MKHEFFIREMEDPDERQRTRLQLQEMMRYGELKTCRRKFLLNYFGETWEEANCGACDVCVPPLTDVSDASASSDASSPFDQELFEKLRALRRSLAGARHVPPYMVFGDKSLQDMARQLPKDLLQMEKIFGVGKAKLKQYGAGFLTVIRAHVEHSM